MKKTFKISYTLLVFLFLYAPIAVLIVFSFNKSSVIGNWTGFTFDWYNVLFNDERILSALSTTMTVAILSALFATILGTLTAFALSKMKKGMRSLFLNIAYLPMLNPEIVTGISLLVLYVMIAKFIPLQPGYMTLLLSHITFNIPYVILSVLPKLGQLNRNVYEAALDLGAPPRTAFFKVIFPEVMPSIITGFILAFTLSFDDFVISYFTCGTEVTTLPLIIYSMTKRGIKPEINALSAIMFIVVLLLLVVVNLRSTKNTKEYAK